MSDDKDRTSAGVPWSAPCASVAGDCPQLSTSYARGRLSKGANLKISADSECVVLARKN